MEANPEFRGIFEELNPNLMKRGFKQAVPTPIKLLGWVANGLKLWALVLFFANPNPNGLVKAAWLYIIAQLVVLVVHGAFLEEAIEEKIEKQEGCYESDEALFRLRCAGAPL